MSAESYPNYSPGLEGVIAGITKISEVSSEKSSLVYYGINVHELAEHGCFEETVYLLLHGKLPNRAELQEFKAKLIKEREVSDVLYDILKKLPQGTHPMDQMRTAYSIIAPFDPDYENNDHDANIRKAIRIIAKAHVIVANGYRIRHGKQPIKPSSSLNTAANFLYMLNDEQKPDEFTEKVLDTSLTLYAEHGFNASTFACRVTVSTLSDIYSGIITGINTLKGPLHGGANEEAMKMLLEVGSPENAERWLRDALEHKKKIMGFGHREYKKGDSRAIYLSKIAKEIGRRKNDTRWGDIATIFEKIMLEEKGLYQNVDFSTGYAYYLLGIPMDIYTPIFAMSRVSGWSAHMIEQLDHNRLIRPKCIYEGPQDVPYVPLEERK